MQAAVAQLTQAGPRLGPLAPASVSALFKNAPKESTLERKLDRLEANKKMGDIHARWEPGEEEYEKTLVKLVYNKQLKYETCAMLAACYCVDCQAFGAVLQ